MATESALLRFLTTTTVSTETSPGRPAPVAPAAGIGQATKAGTIDAATRATNRSFGRIANNLPCSRKTSPGGPADEEPIAQRLAGTLPDPEGAQVRRRREVEPRLPRVERPHVEGRARVLDEVLVVADRRLGRQRRPDLGPLR